jgi:uncharacterized protein (DUF1697 family)
MKNAARTYFAFLRAVNVAGHQPVAMADLRSVLAKIGMHEPQSVLQSGNLIFRSSPKRTDELESLLEREAAKRLALETDIMVRSADELAAIVSANPFRAEAKSDPGHLVVLFCKAETEKALVSELAASITGREKVRAKGKQLYIFYTDGIGRSRLTNAAIERKIGTSGTGRNWNTVLRLAAIAGMKTSIRQEKR